MAQSAYIHIPFCAHKCDFCDFAAFSGLDHLQDDYIEILKQEISGRLKGNGQRKPLDSIFYGGGTPGLIGVNQLGQIQDTLGSFFNIGEDAEITLETTPSAITVEKAQAWRRLGINRLSIGIQSFNDKQLTAIGSGHSRQEALQGIDRALQSGFINLNCDLMYGLPGQTAASWEESVREVLKYPITHLSCYGLMMEKNTPLALRHKADPGVYPDDLAVEGMYFNLLDIMAEAGFEQYEISNFARPGYKSRHNFTYWSHDEYYGFGVSAHRFINGIRSSNWRSLKHYMSDFLGDETREEIDDATRINEAIFLGLRTIKGINISQFNRKYGMNLLEDRGETLEKLQSGGFVEIKNGRLCLTRKGLLVSNAVMSEFFEPGGSG